MSSYNAYRYTKGQDPVLDTEFACATAYEKLRMGQNVLFWKSGLRWYAISLENVQRIYRRVEPVYGKLCCGGRSYVIHRLVLRLEDGKELTLHIGDDEKAAAEALLQLIAERFPHIAIGKETI